MFKKVPLLHKNNKLLVLTIFCSLLLSTIVAQKALAIKEYSSVITGAQQFEKYLPQLKSKRIAIITNITGMVGNTSIVDTLLRLNVNVKKIFGPEHGFRGSVEAGEIVQSDKDKKTGLPIVSLYGKNKKPTKEHLKGIDLVIYDIQDVGVRFYTYISTLCYAMEACAENGIELIVLDRPNPNGFYIDGPVLAPDYKSFLGMHPVPLVYGMSTGEYAKMANEEGWLKNKVKCKLTVVPLKNYDRNASYNLPVKPSPNLPNQSAILLYPSLGLFEGSILSVGRGTDFPFQVIGHPNYPYKNFSFVPKASNLSAEPKYLNETCYGLALKKSDYLLHHPRKIELSWLLNIYGIMGREDFFDDNFNYHSGNALLKQQIQRFVSEEDIRKSWQTSLEKFKSIRKKYLLYQDFTS